MAATADQRAVAADVAERLRPTTSTLYAHANGDGSPKAAGRRCSMARSGAGDPQTVHEGINND